MTLAKSAAVIAALLAAGAAAPAQEALPKAETIIEKGIEASGGRAAHEKLRTTVMEGSIELVGKGVTGTVTVYRAAPANSLTIVEFPGLGKMEEGANGEIAWARSAMTGPRLKEGEEKKMTLRGSEFNGELLWRERYSKTEVTGVETVDGHTCYKVVMTPKDGGKEQTRYYDKDSGQVLKVTMTATTPQGEIPIETFLSDYRKAGTVTLPHKITQRIIGNEIVTTLSSIRINEEIDKGRFAVPADVQALVEKKKQ